MILKNGQIFTALGRFMPADVEIEGGRIAKIAPAGTLDGADVLDAAGRYVTPGFVDIHIHGAKGADFCDSVDGSEEYIRTMAAYLGSQGVTSFLGTTMAPAYTDSDYTDADADALCQAYPAFAREIRLLTAPPQFPEASSAGADPSRL